MRPRASVVIPRQHPQRGALSASAALLALLVSCACQGEPADPAPPTGPQDLATPAPGPAPLLTVDFEDTAPGSLPEDWRAVALGDAPATRWSVVERDGGRCLRADADGGASGLVRALEGKAGLLRWRWRVLSHAAGERDERSREGDDFAARVLVSFASRPGAGLTDSLQDAAARLAGHAEVPAAALAYVVARDLPAGTHFVSPYTERVHTFVLRGRGDPTDTWQLEQRDLAADFETAFGGPVSAVTGLQLLTDSDNSGGQACALYDDLCLLPPLVTGRDASAPDNASRDG